MTEAEKARAKKIRLLWTKIHGRAASYFLWQNYEHMQYAYNAIRDTIDCECGIRVSIDIPTEELTVGKLGDKIAELEMKVFNEYRDKHNIDLGLFPYCE